ncbi:MAG: matrixin family metalloprotease, partial [Deltaproteobacteria bacterium]|nr:matrixin family metalloprotease [Deltaproteobacteria bacterium]
MKIIMLTAAVALFVLCGGAWAGGPLVTVNGRAVVYSENDFPVPYSTDRGSLGSLGNAEATQLVDECFQVWEDVQTSTIMFRNAGQLREDVRLFNYLSYLDDNYDGINPIVFDDDGSIIDAYFGSGQSSYVIGFAGSAYYDSGYSAGYYIEGQAVLNGIFSDAFSYEQFKATFVHEFGHFFGLDHCQINSEYVADGSTVNDAYVPTMYPTATDDDTTLGELNPDD